MLLWLVWICQNYKVGGLVIGQMVERFYENFLKVIIHQILDAIAGVTQTLINGDTFWKMIIL